MLDTPARPLAPRPPAAWVLSPVVQQHAEEAAVLRDNRSVLVRAPHVGLFHLARHDERIAAHLDGLSVAGAAGTARCCAAALDNPGAGETFALALRALDGTDERLFGEALQYAAAAPAARRGFASALGWAPTAQLQGFGAKLLHGADGLARALGLAACRMHRVDPGPALAARLDDPDEAVRLEAVRSAGALGRVDLLPRVQGLVSTDGSDLALQAACAACLLGDRGAAMPVLAAAAVQGGPSGPAALALFLAATPFDEATAWARRLFAAASAAPTDMAAARTLLQALALLGDLRLVPWLIERMQVPTLARPAGEAFTWITGADLAALQLETLQAPALPERPLDDPSDDDVSLDADDDLPWPDVGKVQTWWQRALPALAAAGPRHFMGRPLGVAAAADVLHGGTQRQRAFAALLIPLLEPGRPVFPVAAPAWRQRRWLVAGA